MAENSKIEWTDDTNNFWWGCTKVHAGCDNCYAETLSKRFGDDVWGKDKPRRMIKTAFTNLDKFQRKAVKEGRNRKVFVGSMMDIFEKPMPLVDKNGNDIPNGTEAIRNKFFIHIDLEAYDKLNFLLLTKRPSNINKYIREKWKENPPTNVVYGCSPVDQKTYDTFIRQMEKVKGKKFLSIEPQLGEIELHSTEEIDWIIQGGESGHSRRPFNLDWAYSMT